LAGFARSHRPGPPTSAAYGSGTYCAGAHSNDDSGDAGRYDIGQWHLIRFCDGRYELHLAIADQGPVNYLWMEIDSAPGGCQGVDRVAIRQGDGGSATTDLIATPGCSPDSWSYVTGLRTDGPDRNDLFLWLNASDVGASAFNWRAFAAGPGVSWTSADAVPNGGRARFAG